MKLGELLSNSWSGLKSRVFKHESCVCTFLVTMFIMISVMFWQSTTHITEEIRMMKEHSLKMSEVQQIMFEKDKLVIGQGAVIKRYEEILGRAAEYMQKQDEAIKNLIDEIKRLRADDFIAN